MKMRNLTADGDWTFGKGLQDYVQKNSEIALDISTYLKLWVGNCFWNLQAGINWTQYLDKNQGAQLLAAVQAAILARVGVTGINQLSVNLDPISRQITIEYNVQTVYTQSFQNSITIGATSA